MPPEDQVAFAETFDLVYVTDDEPGFTRRRCGRGFSYRHPSGALVRDKALRQRFADLVIPPAWTEVWICLERNGHMQATGRDDAGRKQYIYNPRWEEARNQAKFERVHAFGLALATIRKRVDADLRRHGLPRERVLALTIALLDETHIRVGNTSYLEQHGTVGLTTLRQEHVEVSSTRVSFEFTGKSGVERTVDLRNSRLARLVKVCQELPGQHLFQYEDEGGDLCVVDSTDVNSYLREIAGEDFSAKDFRTWAGTVGAAEILLERRPGEGADGEQNIVDTVKEVAERLGNTPAVCRQYYIHPAIFDAYLSGELSRVRKRVRKRKGDVYDPAERTVLRLLKQMGYGEA